MPCKTMRKFVVFYDAVSQTIGPNLSQGKELFTCTEDDCIALFWKDGHCRAVSSKKKRKIEDGVIRIVKYSERDVPGPSLFCAYEQLPYGFVYIKTIPCRALKQIGHDYSFFPSKCKLMFLEDVAPESIYVKYAPCKDFQIKQQLFRIVKKSRYGIPEYFLDDSRGHEETLPKHRDLTKNKCAFGDLMLTAKKIETWSFKQPNWWGLEDDMKNLQGARRY